jgi:serine/threonine protein phosphatase PrpC
MKYLFNGASIQNKRSSNMDSLLLKSNRIDEKDALLAVVCDGVGSLKDGAYASGTAVRLLNDWFSSASAADRIGIRMRDCVLAINKTIASESGSKNMDTASTLSALLLVESKYYIVHIGDSRIYSCAQKTLTKLTNDDVSETGKLTGCIGRSENIYLQYSEGDAAGKVFLLCSDGLYKRMDDGFMISKIELWNKKSLKDPIDSLPQYVIERGEHDNISLALVKIEG